MKFPKHKENDKKKKGGQEFQERKRTMERVKIEINVIAYTFMSYFIFYGYSKIDNISCNSANICGGNT